MSESKRKLDLSALDLRKLDLTRKYDDDFSDVDGITWWDHLLLYASGGLLLIFIIWANLAYVDEVSRGTGKVIPSSQIQAIQNLEGGIIEKIMVKEGEVVTAGQIVLRMRNIQAKADLQATNQKYMGLLATITRLQAEADGEPLVFSEELHKIVPESVRAEQDAYDANKRQVSGQTTVLEQQLSQKEQEVSELRRRISDTSGVLGLAKDERAMVAPMVEKGAAAKMELLQLDRSIAQQNAELNGLRLALPRAESAVKEYQGRLAEMTSGLRATAQRDLASKTIELNTIKETLAAYKDRSERTEIKSPVNGKIQDIKITTIGGVVKPGETILEIVPLEDQLVIETMVKPKDIAFITQGQRAVVRISAFDFSIYGAIEGQVSDISADSITNEKGESFYRVKVTTPQSTLERRGKHFEIMPGMQATVDIVTGEKSVMNYLLKPFNKAAETALRER